MQKQELARKIARALSETGFSVAEASGVRSCVDVIAQRKNSKVVIKAVSNIDAVSAGEASMLKRIAYFISGTPIIVGVSSQNGLLRKGISYFRFAIRCVSASEISAITDTSMPYLASKSVGVKVLIDGSKLRALRRISGLTLAELAKLAGVSASTIYKREKGSAFVSLSTAKKLEAVFGESLVVAAQVQQSSSYRGKKLGSSSVVAIGLDNEPFGMIARQRNYYPIGFESDLRTMQKKALFFNRIKEAFDDSIPFFVASKERSIEGIKVIERSKLNSISSEDELLELVY